MFCLSPIKKNGCSFPCGRCMPCRINRTSEWTLRLLYELNTWKHAAFVTLTYSDEFVPKAENGKYTLVKRDLTLFLKRLRKRLDTKIKYFAVGEYGSVEYTHRPHFHLIIFGIDPLNQWIRDQIAESWPYCDSSLWTFKRRHNSIDVVNKYDISYVAGYVQKKLYGKYSVEEYKGIEPPFSRMSQGLGLEGFLCWTKIEHYDLDTYRKVIEEGRFPGISKNDLEYLPMFQNVEKSKNNKEDLTEQ